MLYAFILQQYGGQWSLDGEEFEDLDGEPCIVGFQRADTLDEARNAMVEDLADRFDYPKLIKEKSEDGEEEYEPWPKEWLRLRDELGWFALQDGGHSGLLMF